MEFKKTVFMTGFPGFIAGRLAAKLAKPDTQFLLLVQPSMVEKAMRDIKDICRSTAVPLENFVLIPGDISQPDLGIPPEDLDFVRTETSDIFHLAAAYDLDISREKAVKVNWQGTKNVNDFARSVKKLNRYNYVSTCYVAGKRGGLIKENDLRHNAGFRNNYEETKYMAEMEVKRMKYDYPVTIYRPSVVCGDSRTGETAKYDGVYYVINYLRKFPRLLSLVNIGNEKVRLNIVPVDFVVDAIAALSTDERAAHKTLHIADPNPITSAEMCEVIGRALGGNRSLYKLPMNLCEKILMLPITPAISGLPHSGVPYFFVEQSYDTEIAAELLAPHGIACPRFTDYVGNLTKFVALNPKL